MVTPTPLLVKRPAVTNCMGCGKELYEHIPILLVLNNLFTFVWTRLHSQMIELLIPHYFFHVDTPFSLIWVKRLLEHIYLITCSYGHTFITYPVGRFTWTRLPNGLHHHVYGDVDMPT